MFKVVGDVQRVKDGERRFLKTLSRMTTKSVRCRAGYRGGNMPIIANWSDRLGIWFASQTFREEERYWNAFGTTEPVRGNNTITCEINFPIRRANRLVGGVLIEDDAGQVHVAHRGHIGGGREGIGRSLFFREFMGEKVTVLDDDDEETTMGLVCDLASPRLADQVALFVHEVKRIKKFAGKTGTTVRSRQPAKANAFREEPEERRGYRIQGWRHPSADHGLVVNALAKKLEALGHPVRNDSRRDLLVVGPRSAVKCLFEVKSGGALSDVYQAVGQLLYHSVRERRRPLLALVSPALKSEVAHALHRLGLRLVSYSFDGDSGVRFSGLNEVTARLRK